MSSLILPRSLWRGLVPAFLFALCSFIPADANAVDVISETTDGVLTALRNDQLDYNAKRAKVEGILRQRVDKPIVAQLVLARNWRKLDDGQQKAFVEAFMDHLLLTYWENLARAEISGVEVTSDREEKRGDWTVKTKVDLGANKEPVLMDYRLRRAKLEGGAEGDWRVIDIIVEGVSMVSNFRSQFQEVFSNGGADHLIEAIKKKNETLGARLEKEQAR
jgi:phospholipid transport system substrate-binding protein